MSDSGSNLHRLDRKDTAGIPAREKQAGRVFKPRSGAAFGSDKEVAERLIEEAGGAKRAMALLNVGKGTVYSFSDQSDRSPASFIKYAQVRQLTAAGCQAAAQDLAQLAHGAFIPLPKSGAALPQLSAAKMRESGEHMATAIEALADGRVDTEEARRWLQEAHEEMAQLCSLVGALQAIVDGRERAGADPPD